MDVNTVFVDERCVGALPSCDATSARSQGDQGGLDPRSAVTVEEVRLASDFAVIKVCISKRTDVGLVGPRSA